MTFKHKHKHRKHRKTLKNKIDYYLSKYDLNIKITNNNKKMTNTKIIDMLESMQKLMSSEKNPRARVYSKAKESVMMHDKTIKNVEDLKFRVFQ